jgi:AraC-like DNA-binding protein
MINEALFPSEAEKESLLSILEKVDHELDMNIDNYTQDLLVSNLDLLLNYLNRYYGRQFITRRSLNRDVVADLEAFLLDYINSDRIKEEGLPTVALCAERMNYSSHYLSDLLKKETGRTTQEHIHHHLFEKAKTLLLGTDMTVNEVAYELGFDYPHYFSQTFKKKTGYSPKEFKMLKGSS